ncbi:transcriptional activator NhaR [Glaciimonas sp. CA11.2]|uniref:transcriptional activator NhaR n=1 Tax=unclassified Glaciimonas TaxID=2644401 RepID=UPI002AB45F53|nr:MULTISPECIES: transcriptional activator NhaR [unclassified Glaciimonas]MDY7546196.1 transcriptional activator NhaR [Glaciimonas sp. CA11.2]MEB0010854.1 transcriptional activator NhaR [Glaciimonas sp. Cout2]MEB0081635.1 transcriptional activator NhaR [Glaciimonas sp. Gout2]MEB0161726.1 transcriptional activator NhaR [Glaciimonas sp. CA11.2]
MKSTGLNFRHLHYFWVVAKEGSVTGAADRLGVAVQTISMQLSLLEQSIGKALLAPQGRRLVLTEAGRMALGYADQIFLLGEQMQEALAATSEDRMLRLSVGISDSLPKLIASRLLEAALRLPERVKLICYEDKFESLLGDLTVHKLDVVLTDRPVPSGTTLRVFSHLLGESDIALFGTPELAKRYRDQFPTSLNGAPLLLPTRNNLIRGRIDHWFETRNLRPDVVGEFDDNALLNTFGRSGLGLFPAPSALAADVQEQFGAEQIGKLDQVHEQFYAVSNERKIKHPAIEAILSAIHGRVFTPTKRK